MSQELYQATDMWRKGTDFKQGESSNNVSVSVERKNIPLGKLLIASTIQNLPGKKKSTFATSNIGVIICTTLGKSHTICGTFLKVDDSGQFIASSLLKENIMVLSFTNGQVVHDSVT